VILKSLRLNPDALARETGWEIKPEGACKASICVPLPDSDAEDPDAATLARALGMPLVHDAKYDIWSLGPESGGRVLASADFPDLVLSTWTGDDFDFRTLRGQKIFLLAWASW
jgi:hypothetical protein